MEEKKVVSISLPTILLVLAIIIIIVMGIFMYKINNEKSEIMEKSNELSNTVNELQEKINKISETINSNTSSGNTTNSGNNGTIANNSTTFTDEQVKNSLSNYLDLLAHANCDTLLENLTEKGKLNYDSSKDTISDNGSVLTTIKFSDYKNAMLNYVSESEFEKNWSSTQYFDKNDEGYLTKAQGGGALRVYTIESCVKNNNSTYTAKTSSMAENDSTTKENKEFTFTVKSYKSNCVIDSIN